MILRLLAALLISLLVIAAFVAVAYVTTEVEAPEELVEEAQQTSVSKESQTPVYELTEEEPSEQQDLNDYLADDEIILVEPEPFDSSLLEEPIETQGRYNGRW